MDFLALVPDAAMVDIPDLLQVVRPSICHGITPNATFYDRRRNISSHLDFQPKWADTSCIEGERP
jgi:hypothetical protein